MTTAPTPEPRPSLVDAATAARLRVEEGIIKTLANSGRAAGDDSLSIHLDAVEMADELMEYHLIVSRQAKNLGQEKGEAWHADRVLDAEQIKFHHLDMLDRWLHRAPAEAASTAQRVEIFIEDQADGSVATKMNFLPQVKVDQSMTPAIELASAFIRVVRDMADRPSGD